MKFIGLAGIQHEYLDHSYNNARTNERAVEVPVALDWIGRHPGQGLEVGNVLRHYGQFAHWVSVDAFEVYPNVVNVDILDYCQFGTFDWIVSLSTVEHIGWDLAMPGERDVDKSIRAIDHMRTLLKPDGQMLLSFPTGCHPALDEAAANGDLHPVESVFLLRTDRAKTCSPGTWAPRPFEPAPYRHAARSAGGVWIGVLTR